MQIIQTTANQMNNNAKVCHYEFCKTAIVPSAHHKHYFCWLCYAPRNESCLFYWHSFLLTIFDVYSTSSQNNVKLIWQLDCMIHDPKLLNFNVCWIFCWSMSHMILNECFLRSVISNQANSLHLRITSCSLLYLSLHAFVLSSFEETRISLRECVNQTLYGFSFFNSFRGRWEYTRSVLMNISISLCWWKNPYELSFAIAV